MKTPLIKIGNSRGIRLPKSVIEQCGLEGTVDIQVEKGCVLIRPAAQPRAGWAAAFAEMAKNGDDRLLDWEALPPTEWDLTEWQW